MSYVSQQFLLCDSSSLANFKSWSQAISTALSTSGWTQTADTGQVNWSTIVAVPASGSFVYEIWQPADALQTGSTKFYLKINYGKTSGSPAAPRAQLQIGTGTDGAGSLTGLTSQNYEIGSTSFNGNGSVLTYDCYFAGDTDRFSMLLYRSLNSNQIGTLFTVERTRNTDGTNSSDGAVIAILGTSSISQGMCTLVFGVAAQNRWATATFWGQAAYDGINSSAAFNNNIPVHPCLPGYGKIGNPITTLAFVHNADVAEGCIFTTTLYGASRTYIASQNQMQTPSNARGCMRYD